MHVVRSEKRLRPGWPGSLSFIPISKPSARMEDIGYRARNVAAAHAGMWSSNANIGVCTRGVSYVVVFVSGGLGGSSTGGL